MDNKKKVPLWLILLVLLIIIISVITLMGFLYHKNRLEYYQKEIDKIEDNNKKAFKDYNEDILYNTLWTYNDILNNLIKNDLLAKNTNIVVEYNKKIMDKDDSINFNTLGNYSITIYLNNLYTYKIFKEEKENIEVRKEYILNVIDKEGPIINGVSDKTIYVGDEINLLEGITATDEIEGNIEVKIEGTVDNTKAGSYKIVVSATDSSNNETSKEFTVTVKEKPTSSNVKPSTGTTSKPSSSGSSSSSSGSSSSSTKCETSSSTLRKRGYKTTDPDACSKDREASAIAKQIANEILAKGYTKDIDKVSEAAERVAQNYSAENHTEEGLDYRTPYGVFVKHEASCAGCTRALILVLQYMGFTNLVHANENEWTHQWVILEMDGQKGFADGQVGLVGYGCHIVDDSCE